MKFLGNKMGNKTNKVDKLYKKMLREKSGEERMMMGFSMFQFSTKILLSSLKEKSPARDLKRNIFIRLYGNDFDDKKKKEIIKYLSSQ